MSGRRAKALRRAFFKLAGRAPKGAQVVRHLPTEEPSPRDTVKIAPSRWKRVAETAQRVITEIFVRRIFTVDVVEPSEWRRWKKLRRQETGDPRFGAHRRQKTAVPEGNTPGNDGAQTIRRQEAASPTKKKKRIASSSTKCRDYKRHVWKRYQTHSIGPFPILTGELRCTRCGADRNPKAADGPVHHAEHEGPRYKTDRTAEKGFTKR